MLGRDQCIKTQVPVHNDTGPRAQSSWLPDSLQKAVPQTVSPWALRVQRMEGKSSGEEELASLLASAGRVCLELASRVRARKPARERAPGCAAQCVPLWRTG